MNGSFLLALVSRYLPVDSFWSNIFRREGQQDTYTLLKQIPIFETMNRRELDAVKRIMYRREFRAGEVIFQQGEPGVGMYIVQNGIVAIQYEPTGELLAELHDGDFFGEIALLNETPRSATARARTACTLWGLFQPEVLDLLARNPRLGVKMLLPLAQIAGSRLIRADKQMQQLREELAEAEVKRALETEAYDGAESSPVD